MSTEKRWGDKSLVEQAFSWTTNTEAMLLSYVFTLLKWAITGAAGKVATCARSNGIYGANGI